MKPGRRAVIFHALLDAAIALGVSWGAFALQGSSTHKPDGALYGSVLAFSVATFTISAFVCTMNYTGQNRLLDELVQKYGCIFSDRWIAIFTFEVISSVVPVLLFLFRESYSRLAVSLVIGCLVLATLQVVRSLRLLLALMRVADMSSDKEAVEAIEQAKVLERDQHLAQIIADRKARAKSTD